MIYTIIGALVTGLSLGLFGSGGSILTIPVLLYLLHHEAKVAIAESLGIVGAVALICAIPYTRARLVEWRAVVLFGVPGMVGSYIGAWITQFAAGSIQILVFAAVMLVAAAMMWRNSRSKSERTETQDAEHHRRSITKSGLDGLLVGILTGFVGVGGGFLIVPALVLLGRLPMRKAVATSLVIIAIQSVTGFWKHVHVLDSLDRSVDWGTIAVFVPLGVIGGLVGMAANAKLHQGGLRRGFAMFLVLMSLFIMAQESIGMIRTSREGANTETGALQREHHETS